MTRNVVTSAGPRRALDPELAALQVLIPEVDISNIELARAVEREITSEMRRGLTHAGVEIEDVSCRRTDGTELALRVYRPRRAGSRRLAVLLFLHGGSFVTGGLDTEDIRCASYADDVECVVIAADYRLAPEHPFPAAFDDGCTALAWTVDHAGDLAVDPDRVAIGGLSAGGALAAGIAAHARDEHGPPLVLQLLLFPVLDAAVSTSSVRAFSDTPILSGPGVAAMWDLYLGKNRDTGRRDAQLGYASPSHLNDLRGLPPTFLCTAEFDPLRDEALAFAQRLVHAGVPVDLRHHARAFHSFDSFRATRLAASARRDQVEALRIAFS